MKSKENVTDEDINEMMEEYKSLSLTSKRKENEIVYKGIDKYFYLIVHSFYFI